MVLLKSFFIDFFLNDHGEQRMPTTAFVTHNTALTTPRRGGGRTQLLQADHARDPALEQKPDFYCCVSE